jgi:hypothetical protein
MRSLIKVGLILGFILIGSCVTSHVQTVVYNCSPKPFALYITPFELPQEVVGTYSFSRIDFNNIRLSIINTITKNQCFSSVYDEIESQSFPKKGKDDLSLSIKIIKLEEKSKLNSFESTIIASVIALNSEGNIRKSIDLNVKKSSLTTPADSKNRVIKAFTDNVLNFLNSL